MDDDAPDEGTANASVGDPGGGLVLVPNIDDPDGFYDELLRAHEGLDDAASHALDARLILVLCNHVGDRAVLRAAIEAARLDDG